MGAVSSEPVTLADSDSSDSKHLASRTVRAANRESADVIKVLVWACSDSGAGLLVRMMKREADKDPVPSRQPSEELARDRSTIFKLVLVSIRTLCEQSDRFADRYPTAVDASLNSSKKIVLEAGLDCPITPALADAIKALWNDHGIQRTYQLRARYHLSQSTEYFMGRLDDICRSSFQPSAMDIDYVRLRANGLPSQRTGVQETNFTAHGNQFCFIEVAGQRNERRKW